MMTLFDQEYAVERYGDEKKEEGRVEGRAESLAEGQVEGALKQAKKTAFSLKKEGFSDTMIAKVLSTSLDTVRQWLSDIPDESLC